MTSHMTKHSSCCVLAVLAALSLSALPASAHTISEVTFAGPGGITLQGVLYAPDSFGAGGGGGSYSAVVMLHGCSGMWSNSDAHSYTNPPTNTIPNLSNNVDKWGYKLADQGIVALAVDSFTPRTPVGVNEDDYQHQCASDTPYGGAVDPYTTRAADARAAYDYLTTSYASISSANVGLLGWSEGAEAAMVASAETFSNSNTSISSSDKVFSATVVFYPGCGTNLGYRTGSGVSGSYWRPYDQFRMNMGESDSFYANCDTRMTNAMGYLGVPYIEYSHYTLAAHSFDGVSQTWPSSATCSQPPDSYDTCAMDNGDVNSLSFFQSYL